MSWKTLVQRGLLAALAATMVLAGCQTTNPYTHEGKTSSTA
jgi:hypothetical protein